MQNKIRTNNSDLEPRSGIWLALSDLYLDTELSDNDFKYIAKKIQESPYDIEEVKHINRYELYPLLYPNLLSIFGIWSGFDKEELAASITDRLSRKSWINNLYTNILYVLLHRKYFHTHFAHIEKYLSKPHHAVH